MDSQWTERLKDLAGSWPGYLTVGSFVLYLLGYFCIRFHLTTLGIGTDLTVLDERYLFAGAKFLVYLFSTLANIIFICILLAIVPGIIYLLAQKLRRGKGRPVERARLRPEDVPASPPAFPLEPAISARWKPDAAIAVGLLLATLSIQILMKQCFFFSNLLLARSMPWTGLHFKELLLEEGDEWRAFFFATLVSLTALTSALLFYAWGRVPRRPAYKFLRVLFTLLVGIQFLLLPVNYGVFIMDKEIPRVATLGGQQQQLAADHDLWLVWEGKEGTTFLVSGPRPEPCRRLITIPKQEVKNIEIIGYDMIFRRIFGRLDQRQGP